MFHKLILKGFFSPQQSALARLQLTPTIDGSSDNDFDKSDSDSLLVDWTPETRQDFVLFNGIFQQSEDTQKVKPRKKIRKA